MKTKQRKFLDKLFVFALIVWVMLFVFFTTFCLRIKSRESSTCQRALNTYALVPSTLIVFGDSPARHLNVGVSDEMPSVQNNSEDGVNALAGAEEAPTAETFTSEKGVVFNHEGIEDVFDKSNEEGDVNKLEPLSDTAYDGEYELNDIAEEYKNHAEDDRYQYYKRDKIKTKYDDKFEIQNPELCEDTDVIIIVPSTASNFKARDAIRKTYGTLSRDRKYDIAGVKIIFTVRVLFVFGKTKEAEDRKHIIEERDLYQDILVIDFVDSYFNITRKMINAFRWVDEFCANVSYVIKADDDVFLNVPLLLNQIEESRGKSRDVLFGYVYNGTRPVRRSGRWGVTKDVYPFARYPQYISGTSYTISGHLLRPIVYYAQYFPYSNIEDAFITGVICNKVLGAKLENISKSSQYLDEAPAACDFVASGRLVQTKMEPDTMFLIWNAMLDYNTHCQS